MNPEMEKVKKRIAENGRAFYDEAAKLLSSTSSRRVLILLLVAALIAGWILAGIFMPAPVMQETTARHTHDAEEVETLWTCAMHPQIRLPKPGQCPICGMDLIPLRPEVEESGMPSERRLVMSPEAMQIANIQTSKVERRPVAVDVRMVGKVEYDETRTAYITAWTGGRIDELYVNQTGIPVRKGDHLAYLYSPELLAAQEEYLQALESVKKTRESHLDVIRSTSVATVENARQKLKLLGVTDEQIRELEEEKKTSDHMTIYAPASGIVVEKKVQAGDYVKTGERIFAIVDLSEVWVRLDAYESDLGWLRYGQEVEFEAEAYPGEIFKGRISFIEPILNEMTRTVKVRVNVPNEDLALKPGMFVRAVVHSEVAGKGEVLNTYLADKWICPMHPHVISEKENDCPICGMDLVPAEEMGYTPIQEAHLPLVVPASAVLKTGTRAVVYLQVPDAAKPIFEGREVLLGARAGDYYLIRSGLEEGDVVVTNGNFKIDSALQIQAKPSMMNPQGGVAAGGHSHGKPADSPNEKTSDMKSAMAPAEFLQDVAPVYEAYFALQTSLAKDDLQAAKSEADKMTKALNAVGMEMLPEELHAKWMTMREQISNSLVLAADAPTLETMRKDAFVFLSEQMIQMERAFGHNGHETYYHAFCPMALNGAGASWLQNSKEIQNPYFGASMLNCGEIKENFTAMGMHGEDSGHG